MRCSKARTLILDHVYGELSPRRQRALDRHLQTCSECSKELAAHKATVSTFSTLSMEEPPAELDRRILEHAKEAAERGSQSVRATNWFWRPALAAAAASILVVTVVYYMPRATDSKMTIQKSPATMPMKEASKTEETSSAGAKDSALGGERAKMAARRASVDELKPMDERRDAAIPTSQVGEQSYREQELKYAAPSVSGEMQSVGGASLNAEISKTTPAPAPEPSLHKEPPAGAAPLYDKGQVQQNIAAGAGGRTREGLVGIEHEKSADDWNLKQKKGEEKFEEGDIAFDRLDCDSAIANYEEALKLYPENEHSVEAIYRLGLCYQQSNMYEKALSAYEHIIDSHRDFSAIGEVYLSAGDCLLAIGKITDALRYYETARDSYPAVAEPANEKIQAALKQQEAPTPEAQPSEAEKE